MLASARDLPPRDEFRSCLAIGLAGIAGNVARRSTTSKLSEMQMQRSIMITTAVAAVLGTALLATPADAQYRGAGWRNAGVVSHWGGGWRRSAWHGRWGGGWRRSAGWPLAAAGIGFGLGLATAPVWGGWGYASSWDYPYTGWNDLAYSPGYVSYPSYASAYGYYPYRARHGWGPFWGW
jgi:hypothetical protein